MTFCALIHCLLNKMTELVLLILVKLLVIVAQSKPAPNF